MAHPKLRQQQMLEWLRTCDDERRPFPSDQEVADHFKLASAESARALLVDLADAGSITLTGAGAERVITLGRRKAATFVGAKAAPPVRKPEALVEAQARTASPPPGRRDLISALAKKLPPPATRKPGARAVTTPAPVALPEPAVVAPPPPIEAPAMKAASVASAAPKAKPAAWTPPAPSARQINIKVPEAVYARLNAEAEEKGIATGAHARDVFLALLDGNPAPLPAPVAELPRKPLVRAEMTAVAIRDHIPIDAFVRIIMERGFRSYCDDVAAEMAEAAE